jgi:hypothetical protein
MFPATTSPSKWATEPALDVGTSAASPITNTFGRADPASPFGYVAADKHTLRHPDWPNVFALGDAANLPTSKTGAAIRKQSPVVAANLLAAMHGGDTRSYDGYTSCPLVTSRNQLLLASSSTSTPRMRFPTGHRPATPCSSATSGGPACSPPPAWRPTSSAACSATACSTR